MSFLISRRYIFTCVQYILVNGYSVREASCLRRAVRSLNNVPLLETECVSPTQVTSDNQYDSLAGVVTPLWQVPYQEQLQIKWKWSQTVLENFVKKLRDQTKRKKVKKISYKLHQVKPSPVTEGYRNKDEFSIQIGIDGCVRGTHLINMRQSHKQVAQAYEDYIRLSPLPACLHLQDGGHWRSLVVRSSEEGQIMAIVVFNPQNLEQERLEEEGAKLRDFFLHGSGARCNLSSLYFQPCRHTRCTADQAPYTLLFGDAHLTERLGDFRFQISPDSFFQVNTAAATVLYNTVFELAGLTQMTTLLDVCCGTGTVSILASRHVRGAVGVESVYSAVTDARKNALANGVYNVEFIPGLAEKKIPKIITELGMASDIAAVVNPGRSGLHHQVVKALCSCQQIRHVVYVSCKADSPNTMSNFIQLCDKGQFSLSHVVPVDLFPHTLHTELVMAFNR
ncbi:tRNA (uracil(54)-C(5))-methyltransferase homolog [Zootermopsis nevadensis]|uniref:tRNA (uracil(54)-C(5))-methyltransferase homolog n=1 Tax=Zootermopsis nevadensis TaxID=136037 RepID=UPI000B8E8ADC|nr:tRNA (uracil(54)-C(5))-methyltransferase homolog [Zootermopsis nevadensis]